MAQLIFSLSIFLMWPAIINNMVRRRVYKKAAPFRRPLDLFITLFLLAAFIYLGRDLLRTGRLTFIHFKPTSITWDSCNLSPPPREAIESWDLLVRNSRTLSSLPSLALREGGPLLRLQVTGKKGNVLLTFYRQGNGMIFLARGKDRVRAFQLDLWTFNRVVDTLKHYCKEEKR